MAKGRLRECRSVRSELTREEEEVPRRKSVVLGFSLGRGAFLARARAERAFFGLLDYSQSLPVPFFGDFVYFDVHFSKHDNYASAFQHWKRKLV